MDSHINIETIRKKLRKTKEATTNLIEYLDIPIEYINGESSITIEDKLILDTYLLNNPNTRVLLQKLAFIKKYGVDNPSKCSDIKEKANNTIKEKYGVDNISQSQSIKDKKKETTLSNYGVDNPMKDPTIVQKVKELWDNKSKEEIESYTLKGKQTRFKLYGNENYNNALQISNTRKNMPKHTMVESIGKSKLTRLQKYGKETYNNRNKAKETFLENYGVDNIFKSENFISTNKIKRDRVRKENIENNFYFLSDVANIINRDYSTLVYDIIPKLDIPIIENNILNNKYMINGKYLETLIDYCKKTESVGTSYGEKEIVSFIKDIYKGKVIENDRSILNGKELDIYIPEYNLAIEFNGIYWHSEMLLLRKENIKPSDLNILRNKHLEKTEKCEKLGIRLIHILDIEWYEKKDIYKSIIASALGIYTNKIYARECEFKEVPLGLSKQFLNENHIQGYGSSNISFGLFYKDILVQCMNFQYQSTNDKQNCELNRMVTRLGYQVLGGFSKLLINANKTLKVESLVSYIDRSIFFGKGYEKVGFSIIKTNPPSYKWYYKGKLYRREFSMKKNQQKRFDNKEQLFFNSDKTEIENMIDNRIPRIWNCGTYKVEYRFNK